MGITEAIARVRASAKKAGLDSALASLGAGLKSSAIPAPLRPAATRIASLIGAQRTEPRDVASLERALEHAHAGPHGATDVCPFTGLRADASVAETQSGSDAAPSMTTEAAPVEPASVRTSLSEPLATPASEPHASADVSGIQPVLKLAPLPDDTTHPAQPAAPVDDAVPAVEPSAPASDDVASAAAQPATLQDDAPVAKPDARANGNSQRAQKAQPSGKEKLAGDQSPAKTTARSANKSASEQTNGRAPSNRKKS